MTIRYKLKRFVLGVMAIVISIILLSVCYFIFIKPSTEKNLFIEWGIGVNILESGDSYTDINTKGCQWLGYRNDKHIKKLIDWWDEQRFLRNTVDWREGLISDCEVVSVEVFDKSDSSSTPKLLLCATFVFDYITEKNYVVYNDLLYEGGEEDQQMVGKITRLSSSDRFNFLDVREKSTCFRNFRYKRYFYDENIPNKSQLTGFKNTDKTIIKDEEQLIQIAVNEVGGEDAVCSCYYDTTSNHCLVRLAFPESRSELVIIDENGVVKEIIHANMNEIGVHVISDY